MACLEDMALLVADMMSDDPGLPAIGQWEVAHATRQALGIIASNLESIIQSCMPRDL